jgi:hypothetical protein
MSKFFFQNFIELLNFEYKMNLPEQTLWKKTQLPKNCENNESFMGALRFCQYILENEEIAGILFAELDNKKNTIILEGILDKEKESVLSHPPKIRVAHLKKSHAITEMSDDAKHISISRKVISFLLLVFYSLSCMILQEKQMMTILE